MKYFVSLMLGLSFLLSVSGLRAEPLPSSGVAKVTASNLQAVTNSIFYPNETYTQKNGNITLETKYITGPSDAATHSAFNKISKVVNPIPTKAENVFFDKLNDSSTEIRRVNGKIVLEASNTYYYRGRGGLPSHYEIFTASVPIKNQNLLSSSSFSSTSGNLKPQAYSKMTVKQISALSSQIKAVGPQLTISSIKLFTKAQARRKNNGTKLINFLKTAPIEDIKKLPLTQQTFLNKAGFIPEKHHLNYPEPDNKNELQSSQKAQTKMGKTVTFEVRTDNYRKNKYKTNNLEERLSQASNSPNKLMRSKLEQK